MELLRIVFTSGRPRRAVVNGYVIWSSTSCGLLPGHSVKTICWFSPISGMASTATGWRGKNPSSQSNGAKATPIMTKASSSNATTSLFSRQKRINRLITANLWLCLEESQLKLMVYHPSATLFKLRQLIQIFFRILQEGFITTGAAKINFFAFILHNVLFIDRRIHNRA